MWILCFFVGAAGWGWGLKSQFGKRWRGDQNNEEEQKRASVFRNWSWKFFERESINKGSFWKWRRSWSEQCLSRKQRWGFWDEKWVGKKKKRKKVNNDTGIQCNSSKENGTWRFEKMGKGQDRGRGSFSKNSERMDVIYKHGRMMGTWASCFACA